MDGVMAAISMDLRVRIFDALESGDTTSEVSERFSISSAFVRRLKQRHRETGSLAPSDARRGPKPRLAPHADRIQKLVAEHPDLTAAEIRDCLGLKVSNVTVWRTLRQLGLTFKKNPLLPTSGPAKTSRRHERNGLS